MTTPFGMTQRAVPSEAATANPVPAPESATVMLAAPMFWISMNSSFAPLGPRRRNSEMTSDVEPAAAGSGLATSIATTVDAARAAVKNVLMKRCRGGRVVPMVT